MFDVQTFDRVEIFILTVAELLSPTDACFYLFNAVLITCFVSCATRPLQIMKYIYNAAQIKYMHRNNSIAKDVDLPAFAMLYRIDGLLGTTINRYEYKGMKLN